MESRSYPTVPEAKKFPEVHEQLVLMQRRADQLKIDMENNEKEEELETFKKTVAYCDGVLGYIEANKKHWKKKMIFKDSVPTKKDPSVSFDKVAILLRAIGITAEVEHLKSDVKGETGKCELIVDLRDGPHPLKRAAVE